MVNLIQLLHVQVSYYHLDHTKSLGLMIDDHLFWCKHVDEICKKVSSAIGALKQVWPFISKETAIQVYNALIMPHFDYCSPIWDYLSVYLSNTCKLQKLQNQAARIITKSPFDTSSDHLLSTLEGISSAEETESLNDV